jgi:pyruvate dehydrogenase E2 component (dihydrolipoamide acetyltransferase)
MSVTRVIMPKLGLTMDEGRLIAWHKKEGDRVAEGEVLFEVETDKAAMEVPATTSGFVRRLLAKPEDMVPVATVVAILTETADEAVPAEPAPIPRPTISPQPPAPPEPIQGSSSSSSSSDRVIASPAARKRAQELSVDLATVVASKPPRISIEDVEAAAASPTAASAAASGEKRIPLSRMRKAIAAAMSRSTREAPQFSIERDVDMGAANARRKAAGASYTDVVVSAAAKALAGHPRLRSRFDGEALVEQSGVHVGLAVAVSDGLLVPVIRDADKKDLAVLVREREHLEEGAHAGKLSSDALTGGVFSVSNLGSLGVDRFTALVNPPEAAILAMGRVRDRVVARDGKAEVRPVVTLTLSVDHRVADGADAARFLDDVAKRLEAGE